MELNNERRGAYIREFTALLLQTIFWHMDTNHKLIRWNLVIAGGIDGFSRFVVFLKCVDNNRADTIFTCFESGVQNYGVPLRVHSDQGLENLTVAEYMTRVHGSDKSIIV